VRTSYLGLVLALTILCPVSADVLRVEKDGSGDFTVIQDALDAAAPGDSVLVGTGRFDDFRAGASVIGGSEFQAIAWLKTADVTLVGAGAELTTLGPDSLVSYIGGLPTMGVYVDGGATIHIEGIAIEQMVVPIRVRNACTIQDAKVTNPGVSWGLIVSGTDNVIVRSCRFLGSDAIWTASPAVAGLLVDDCEFYSEGEAGQGVAVGNGASGALIRRCRFYGVSEAINISLSSSGTVEDCVVLDSSLAAINVTSASAIIRRTWIGDGPEIALRVNNGRIDCYESRLGAGTFATIVAAGDMLVRDSHILHGSAPAVYSIAESPTAVDLRANWWGTTEIDSVASWIEDLGAAVLYEPILSAPVGAEQRSIGSVKDLFRGPDRR